MWQYFDLKTSLLVIYTVVWHSCVFACMCMHTYDIFCVTLEKDVLLSVSQRCNIIKIRVKHTPSLSFHFLLFKSMLRIWVLASCLWYHFYDSVIGACFCRFFYSTSWNVCVCVRACALRRMLCIHAVPHIQRSEKIIWGLVLTIHFVCDSVSCFSMHAPG